MSRNSSPRHDPNGKTILSLLANFDSMSDVSENELLKISRSYYSIDSIIDKEMLSGVTFALYC